MSKRSFRTALIIVIGSLAIVAGLLAFFIHRAISYADEPYGGSGKEIEVEIASGMSFPAIASRLSDRGVIERPTWFRILAMWEGKTADVKPGKYLIKDNETPRAVLAKIVAGVKEVTVRVTLPEGENMLDFFRRLEDAKVAPARELEALARDREFLGKFAISGDTADGYLFPDTYQFRVGEKPTVVLQRLITRHQEVWNDLVTKHPRDTAKIKEKLGWSDRDILTMASIVEKEAVEPSERPRIAQVFINRLISPSFKPKRLETDPTIRYGCLVPTQKSAPCVAWIEMCTKVGKAPGCERLYRAQLDDKDNVYNTYQHEGLPPGPISNPGRKSIEATLSPDGSDYFFFVATSKNSRSHAFARSISEHERNVKKYLSSSP
ncbi:MAG: endolytic transglycosylase MltG [Kofleriaceae bacterium]